MALASRAIPPRPTATATRVSAIGTSAARIVPKATTSTTRAASRPAASAPDVSVSALMNAASPPSSAAMPASRAGAIASATAVSGAGPSSVAGRSKTISAKPTRPSGDTVPAANGSATVATCSTPAIRARAASTAGRWPSSRSPSGAANTARALPPAASGKRSSSSTIASSLWLPGATRSSVNEPPALPASPRTTAAATAHIPMVAHGLRALASPMRRVMRCMTVLLRWSGSDGGRRRWRRGTTLTAGAGGVARPRTGWPSPARRVLAGPRRPAAPRTAGTASVPRWMTARPASLIVGRCPLTSPDGSGGPSPAGQGPRTRPWRSPSSWPRCSWSTGPATRSSSAPSATSRSPPCWSSPWPARPCTGAGARPWPCWAWRWSPGR